jgi:hypothetical protein
MGGRKGHSRWRWEISSPVRAEDCISSFKKTKSKVLESDANAREKPANMEEEDIGTVEKPRP